ncbi:MAG: hypothetical protein JJU10_07625 [Idiomarina sp.]|nr:hypothetical protein [Idiomarina sp.]
MSNLTALSLLVGSALCALSALSVLYAPPAAATPWLEPGDTHLRNSVQVLADAGYLRTPVNTYPLNWSSIVRDLRRVNMQGMSTVEREAYMRVAAALDYNAQGGYSALTLAARSSNNTIHGPADVAHEEAQLGFVREFQSDHVAFRISTQYRGTPEDGRNYGMVGSYIAGTFGNWSVSAEQIPYWWGPAHDQALVMSNNARAIQAVRVSRLFNEDSQIPVLSLLGPWHATAFVGRNQDAGDIEGARMFGARLGAVPIRGVELGLSYTGQWGGREAPSSTDGMFNILSLQSTDEGRNRLLGADIRVRIAPAVGLYGEYVVSQRSVNPSGRTLGADYRFYAFERTHTLFAEFYDIEEIYTDSRDPAGYRRWGRSMGASVDENVTGVTLGYASYDAQGRGVEARVRSLDLSPVESDSVSRHVFDATYQQPFGNSVLRVGVQYWADSGSNGDSESIVRASWERRW